MSQPQAGYDEDEESGPVVVEGIDNESGTRTVSYPPSQQRVELAPADFLFGKTLGEGAFARVVHARSKKTGSEFAIKIMEKRHIKKENKVIAWGIVFLPRNPDICLNLCRRSTY